jgi:hypothetical protein
VVLRRVVLEIINVLEEQSASIITVTRINELGTTLPELANETRTIYR